MPGSAAADRRQRVGLDRLVEHLADPPPAGERVRQLGQRVADQAQREHEQREQVDEAGQLADREVAAAHAERRRAATRPTLVSDGSTSSSASNVPRRRTAPMRAVAQAAGDLRQPLGLAVLGAVGLDELHAVEALVDAGREVAEVVLGGVVVDVDALLVDDVEADQQREHGDGDERRARRRWRAARPPTRRSAARCRWRTGSGRARRRRRRCRRRRGRRGRRRAGGRATTSAGATRRSTTPWPSVPATRHCVLPAHVRRTTTPAARSRPMPMISPTPATHGAGGDRALVEAGHDDVVDDPADRRRSRRRCTRANTAAPSDGDGERPRVQAAPRPEIMPEALAGAVEALPGRRSVPRCSVLSAALGHGVPGCVGRVPAWTRSTSRCSCCASCSGCSSPPTATTRSSVAAAWPARRGGSGRSACAGRSVQARARRVAPRSAPACCSPLGLLTPFAAAGMIGVMVVASWAAHRHNGFFIFRKGEGWEYTVVDRRRRLGASPRSDPATLSLDHAIGLDWTAWDGWIGAVIAGVLGVGGGDRPARRLLPPGAARRDDRDADPPRRRRRASSPWRDRADGRRRSASPRSGSGRCSSPPRSRSTGSATGRGPTRAAGDLRGGRRASARRSPTCAASTRTTRRWSPSAATSSTGRPTSSSRCSTTSSPSRRPDAKGADLVPLWEADYRTYIEDRRALRRRPARRRQRRRSPRRPSTASRSATSSEVFAADNEMPACAPPHDLSF